MEPDAASANFTVSEIQSHVKRIIETLHIGKELSYSNLDNSGMLDAAPEPFYPENEPAPYHGFTAYGDEQEEERYEASLSLTEGAQIDVL